MSGERETRPPRLPPRWFVRCAWLVVPHAGHTQGLAAAPRAWEAHVIGFLDAALKSA